MIDAVTAGLTQPATTVLGPGDDAAVVAAPDGRVVASMDVLVDGVHFRTDWATAEQIGRRARCRDPRRRRRDGRQRPPPCSSG